MSLSLTPVLERLEIASKRPLRDKARHAVGRLPQVFPGDELPGGPLARVWEGSPAPALGRRAAPSPAPPSGRGQHGVTSDGVGLLSHPRSRRQRRARRAAPSHCGSEGGRGGRSRPLKDAKTGLRRRWGSPRPRSSKPARPPPLRAGVTCPGVKRPSAGGSGRPQLGRQGREGAHRGSLQVGLRPRITALPLS